MNIKRYQRQFVLSLVIIVVVALVLVLSAANTISISQESDYYHEHN